MEKLPFGAQHSQRSLHDFFSKLGWGCVEENANISAELGYLHEVSSTFEPLCCSRTSALLLREGGGMVRRPFFLGSSCVYGLVPELDEGCTASPSARDPGSEGSLLHEIVSFAFLVLVKATRVAAGDEALLCKGEAWRRLPRR